MSIYKAISDTNIKRLNNEYDQASDAYNAADQDTERAKHTATMQSVGTEVEEHLQEVGRTLKDYFAKHSTRVDNWVRLSEKAIKDARKAAAAYKKDTSTGVPPQIQQAVTDIQLYAKAINDDATDFGGAWFKFRNAVAPKVPAKYKAAFETVRGKVMEDQKAITTRHTRLLGYVQEAEGLAQVAAKATMKARIKAGTGTQRPITDARADAVALAQQMDDEFKLLQTPRGLAIQPGAIALAVTFAKQDSKNKAFTKTPANVATVNGRKKTFEQGVKLMRTRVASMEKLLATKTKGFRSNELSDVTVKAELKKAQKSLKDAKADLKKTEEQATKGLGYLAAIEKRWKK